MHIMNLYTPVILSVAKNLTRHNPELVFISRFVPQSVGTALVAVRLWVGRYPMIYYAAKSNQKSLLL